MNSHLSHNPLKEAYTLLQVSSPSELAKKFIKEDQRLLQTQAWDYMNQELVLNKVKEIVESAIDNGFTTGDKDSDDDLRNILWFWYHHAIGYAIWGYKDKMKAFEFSSKALKYQTSDNPNQITRLLYLLIRNEDTEATAWLETIVNDPDKTASRGIMKEYLAGNFFKR
ncbi:MAG: hypothetical protein Q8P17_04540 [bacterium]|nr:hypothetical protein [bacterium]